MPNEKAQLCGFESWKISFMPNEKPQLRRFENCKISFMPNEKPQLRGFENCKIRLMRSRKLYRRPSPSAMPCCHRRPGGLPHPCGGSSTGCSDSNLKAGAAGGLRTPTT